VLRAALTASVFVVLAAREGAAQERDHRGAYVRTFLGVIGTRMDGTGANESAALTGAGGGLGVAVGGTISRNAVFFFELFGKVLIAPIYVRTGGDALRQDAIVMGSLGPGFGYTFTSVDLSVAGTAWLAYGTGFGTRRAAGLGASVTVGREWWLKENVGVGLCARLSYGNVQVIGEYAPGLVGGSLLIGGSLTYH
jgi:hypothetical protein